MCMVFYVAADRPLPLIPWREDRRGFHVTPVPDREAAVATQFTQPQVYYVGSHLQCGCGFTYPAADAGDPERAAAVASVRSLRDYLAAALDAGATLELFACWEGDWTVPPDQRVTLAVEDIGGPAFAFAERTFAHIVPRPP